MRRRTSCAPGTATTSRPSDRSSPSEPPTRAARNANSLLYGASWRAAKALGYRRLITCTQEGESSASLRGAGWHLIAARSAPATATTASPASCGKPREPHAWRCPAHLRTHRPRRDVPASSRRRRDRGHPRPPHHRGRHRPVQRHTAHRPAVPPRCPHGR
ncbi:XF1762 family protein [Streptomyces sp. SLBN-8D4]|uniref:XF1762 family protein n=1 Tax=Streptomyces sp. SLBN-8D4 TaxID=3377728 RepID=UPI003C7B9AC2